MKNIYTIIFFIIASVFPATAQQMFVEKNGSTETIELSNLDKITFSGITVNIVQNNGNSISASMGEIERIHFSDYSNIGNTPLETGKFISYISCDEIEVNCIAGKTITVYDIIGTQLICTRQKADNGTISIASLPKGIYIVKADNRTAKFVKR